MQPELAISAAKVTPRCTSADGLTPPVRLRNQTSCDLPRCGSRGTVLGLKKLAGGQVADEIPVGGQEIIPGQLV